MTALVYLAIIALWALFLIPWLGRQRDEQAGRRSGERYNTAMRELRNRHAEHHETADAEPAFDEAEEPRRVEDESAGPRWGGLVSRFASLRPARRAGSSPAARRRRLVLAILGAGLLASIAGVAAGMLPAPVPAVFAVLLAAYLAALAGQSRRSRSAASAGSGSDAARHREAARLAHLQAQNLMGMGRAAEQPADSRWDAQPTHVPVYVSKPRASKVPRVMDPIRSDETWTGQDMVARAQEMKRQARLAQEQFEREIAVVEPDPVAEVARMANPDESEPYRRAANG